MLHLQAVTPRELTSAVDDLPIEEARRIVSAVHRHDHLPAAVRGVRRLALGKVRDVGRIPSLTLREIHASRIDPFVKFSLDTPRGEVIETVRIPLEKRGRYSVCVSSQAGCGFGCAFCATGRLGFLRNLETWEIVEQVRVVRRTLDRSKRERVHGIVFQGMGEPLANIDSVIEAIRVLCEPSGIAVDGRAVTVCTAGLPNGILRLAHEVPKTRLGISIASARPEVRNRLMPIDRAYPLHSVIDAAAEHVRITGLAPMWSFTLLEGVNDSQEDAVALARLARHFAARTGIRPRISIVPYNSIDPEGPQTFARSGEQQEESFRRILRESGVPSHKRYSGGSDVDAACGQLAGARPA